VPLVGTSLLNQKVAAHVEPRVLNAECPDVQTLIRTLRVDVRSGRARLHRSFIWVPYFPSHFQPNIQFQQFSVIRPTDAWVCPHYARGALTNSAGEHFQYEYRPFLRLDQYVHTTSTFAVRENATKTPPIPPVPTFSMFNGPCCHCLMTTVDLNCNLNNNGRGIHFFPITFFDVTAYLIGFDVHLL
jgi:hypothetical protein